MKINISKRVKRTVAIYIAVLIILYVIIYVFPKVTDLFESTETLENGSLIVSCETTGYFVKDETINLSEESGEIKYRIVEGTAIKKGTPTASVEAKAAGGDGEKDESEYGEYLKRLKGYGGIYTGTESPISGVFSLCTDGYEDYFCIDNIDNIKKEKTEELKIGEMDLERENVVKGEPIFKVSGDDIWYIVCWLDEDEAKGYEKGAEVELRLPDGSVPAEISGIKKEGEFCKVVFRLNAYYKSFAQTRAADMSIVLSNNTGLIVDNKCIVEKNGQKGVYVRDKDGNYSFMPVNITVSDDKQSVLSEKTFTNEDYELVETVIVHDEVLKNPEKALEEDLKKEAKDKKERE